MKEKKELITFFIELGELLYPCIYKQGTVRQLKPITEVEYQAALKTTGVDAGLCQVRLNRKYVTRKDISTKTISNDDLHAVCLRFLNSYKILDNERAWCEMLLYGLVSRIADKLVCAGLETMPTLYLRGVPAIPKTLEGLLTLLSGPTQWCGSGWIVNQPSIIHPIVGRHGLSISMNSLDYAGLTIGYRKASIQKEVPYQCRIFAITPGVPHLVEKSILEASPLAIPILCRQAPKKGAPLSFEFEGSDFDFVDLDLYDQFQIDSEIMATLIEKFIHQFHRDKKLVHHWRDDCQNFCRFKKSGRFTIMGVGTEVSFLARCLSLFHCLLIWLRNLGVLMDQELQEYLLIYWGKVLPETVPNNKGLEVRSRIEDPNLFLAFLDGFVREHAGQIAALNEEPQSDHIGTVHRMSNKNKELLLILPRCELFAEWKSHIVAADGDITRLNIWGDDWEAKLQRTLCDQFQFIKRAGRDYTWKYSWRGSSIPCIGIDLDSYPNLTPLLDLTLGDLVTPIPDPVQSSALWEVAG